ncbi:flagellin [Tropicimonas isoalkanivorans]|uniref:Flagellin n=1 Tax=Tropicimonas isoalkanivorans TaxID=441112 RepID=A0A1I1RWZ9_9RHOB|nr:flagellin [Tropicimonas isoalkanivorans]SFD35180.1 flagellin [Tropicimonas isoalkanivorans]
MTSILTNTSSMVALQTLKGINNNLNQIQSEISTGKSVSSAKDNAAVWAISKVMESDVKGFQAISDSLALGESTVAVARNASETVTDLLTQMKEKVVSAQEENVDREKIQTDIEALKDQIGAVVGAAQFNGLNLVDGSSAEDVTVLSSLDRDASGTVSASHITVARQDLSVSNTATGATFGTTAVNDGTYLQGGGGAVTDDTATAVAESGTYDVQITSVHDKASYRLTLDDTAAGGPLGQRVFEYVADADDSVNSVAATLETQVSNFLSATGDNSEYTVSRNGDTLTFTNVTGGNAGDLMITMEAASDGTAGTSAGGLGNLATIDVTTDAGANAALTSIESMIDTAINASAAFGSVQGRIETQSEFISNLTDSMKAGIGTLVDADMEEASARLQALQVQQQLGIQSLSIANQSPQSVLSLFR